MALAVTEKAQGKADTVNTAYATANIAPVAGAGYLLWVAGGDAESTGAAPNVSPATVTGMGMTWVKVLDVTSANGTVNLSLWRAFTATPTTGALTVTWPNTAIQDSFAYKLTEVTGMSTSGTNGSGMVAAVNVSTFSGATQNPAGTLPNSLTGGDRVISGIAVNAGDIQTVTEGTTNAMTLVGPIGGRSLNPAIQLGVEIGDGGNAWDWTTTTTASKAVIAIELVQDAVASTLSIREKISGSIQVAASQSAFTTASVNAVAGSGYLLWVSTGVTAAAASPSSVTGMGMTWVKVAEQVTGNGNVMLSAWRARINNPSSTALTINYAAPITSGTVEWKLDEISGMATTGTNGSGMIRATNITLAAYLTTGNVATTLAQTPLAGNLVASGMSFNSGGGQTVSAGTSGNWQLVGGPIQLGTPVANSLAVESGPPAGNTLDWSTSSTSAKAIIILEIVAAGATSPLVANAGADVIVDGYDTFSRTATASGGSGGNTFAWTRLSFTGAWTPTLTGATTATVGFATQPDRVGNVVTLRVTVTDSSGSTDTDDVIVTVAAWNLYTRRAGVLTPRRRFTRRAGVLT